MALNQLVNWAADGTASGMREGIIEQVKRLGVAPHWKDIYTAYTLATVKHETGNRFRPVKEIMASPNRQPKLYRRQQRYSPYFGRGLVQITWKKNYEKYERLLAMPLIEHPEMVLRSDVSLFILVHGMYYGTFTGVGFDDYTNPEEDDFIEMREIVNGSDKAKLIAGYASQYLKDF